MTFNFSCLSVIIVIDKNCVNNNDIISSLNLFIKFVVIDESLFVFIVFNCLFNSI